MPQDYVLPWQQYILTIILGILIYSLCSCYNTFLLHLFFWGGERSHGSRFFFAIPQRLGEILFFLIHEAR